jgi:hypothetical protein
MLHMPRPVKVPEGEGGARLKEVSEASQQGNAKTLMNTLAMG